MLDFGWPEFFLILVVAVMAAGPNDIPKILYEAGKLVRRLQYLRFAANQQFEEFMRENDLDDLRKSALTRGDSDFDDGTTPDVIDDVSDSVSDDVPGSGVSADES